MSDEYRKYLEPRVVSRLANMELRARLIVEGFIAGLHRSPYRGFSVEFAEHRQYMPGDEIKHVDWKVYARTDRFYIKQYEEETNLKATILLDTSMSMGYASPGHLSKLEYGSYLAAALSYMMIKQQDAVGLAMFDERVHTFLPPHATKGYLRQILIQLQKAVPAGKTGAGRSLHQVADRLRRRGLVIIISDFLDEPSEVMSAVKHFRHKKNEVIVMQVLDPLERSFDFGTDAMFRDLETSERLTTRPYQIQRAYRQAIQDFVARYKRECLENYVDYVLMDTATPFDTAILSYLSKRERIQ